MKLTRILGFIASVATAAVAWANDGATAYSPLVNTDRVDHPLEIEVHALGGVSVLTQNYANSIADADYVKSAPGASLGAGVRVDFPLNRFFALGTGLDMLWSHNTCTMTMASQAHASSTVYNSNSYLYARMPLVGSFRFSLSSVQWEVNGGLYLATGVWGKQKSQIFTTTVNQLNQLVTDRYAYNSGYFREDDPLIAAHHTFDFGLTIGTGVIVTNRWTLGVSVSYGLKNSAKNVGTLDTRNHNVWALASVGYRF